jgi:hypothetical protein
VSLKDNAVVSIEVDFNLMSENSITQDNLFRKTSIQEE